MVAKVSFLRVVIKQQEGLSYHPALMLIDDADTQAKWYNRLKQEYENLVLVKNFFTFR